jgi:uncharacterized RDD family membrane protein YckC
MGQQWHYTQGGAQAGPVDVEALRQMVAAGQLGPDELVWTDGMPEWQRAGNIPLFFAQPAQGFAPQYPQQPGHPGQGGYYPPQYGAPGPINYYSPQATVQFGGFWLRFCAVFIDGIILQVIQLPIGLALGTAPWQNQPEVGPALLNMVLGIVIAWLYSALQESSEAQATLGKRAVGLIVTDTRGNRISFGRASGRHFAKIISGLILAIGYIMAAFTERKQALHDMMADTLVLKKNGGT